jgi:hypothetical protein
MGESGLVHLRAYALAWLPVALVGATSAWLFKRGRHLLPCVLLHMTYNAVLVWAR